VELKLTRPVMGALLAVAMTCGGAAAAKLQGDNWCRVEPGWSSSVRQKLDLQALLGRHSPSPHRVAVSRPVVKVAAVERATPVVRLHPAAPAWRAPAKEVEVASCSGGHASILCPGYQLIGFEY